MQAKALSEIEQAIENYVTQECGIAYTVAYTCEQTRDNDWKCDGWRFAIKGQSFEYFTGTGHREKVRGWRAGRYSGATFVRGDWEASYAVKPPIAGLLHSLMLDGSACSQSFEQWCMECGYDSDSRKALATYEACQQGYDKLRNVFTSTQIERLRELLQDY